MKSHEQEWAAVPASATGCTHELHHGPNQGSCTPWGIDEEDFAELRLVAQAPAMARLLLEVQWSAEGTVCPWCDAPGPESSGDFGHFGTDHTGHRNDCRLIAVLRAAGVLE